MPHTEPAHNSPVKKSEADAANQSAAKPAALPSDDFTRLLTQDLANIQDCPIRIGESVFKGHKIISGNYEIFMLYFPEESVSPSEHQALYIRTENDDIFRVQDRTGLEDGKGLTIASMREGKVYDVQPESVAEKSFNLGEAFTFTLNGKEQQYTMPAIKEIVVVEKAKASAKYLQVHKTMCTIADEFVRGSL